MAGALLYWGRQNGTRRLYGDGSRGEGGSDLVGVYRPSLAVGADVHSETQLRPWCPSSDAGRPTPHTRPDEGIE